MDLEDLVLWVCVLNYCFVFFKSFEKKTINKIVSIVTKLSLESLGGPCGSWR